ncbi:ubiquitin-conjugating enzyme/RWD-like protein [Delphinella strobiligena]|nr:ubiquitin-conjugating enzyme/RWD-like protein [Delphinella strobiligena]
MAANRNRRLVKEIQDVQKDSHSGVILEPFSKSTTASDTFDDLTHFKGVFKGPPDTPYEGGTFLVDIRIPSDYPFQPPIMKFITKIWHPNVSSVTGAICLDTLASAWSPVLTLKSALISLQSLLSSPEPKDPQDAEVARMLLTNPREFAHVAREWAIRHAGAPVAAPGQSGSGAEGSGGVTEETLRKKDEQKREKAEAAKLAAYRGFNKQLIDRFAAMGFDVPTVVNAFEYVGIDRNDGEDYELEEEYMGDVTARLFGEA